MSLLTLAAIRRLKPRVTPWATAPDISGTGQDIVSSSAIYLVFDSLALADIPMIEVRFTQQTDIDSVLTWVRVSGSHLSSGVGDNEAVPEYNTGVVIATGVRTRVVRIKPLIFQHISNVSRTFNPFGLTDRLRIYVRSRGYSPETNWSVTNIRARLVYTPLVDEEVL